MVEERVPVVSFTFGCPAREEIEWPHDAGAEAWVTVTTPGEAVTAAAAGADALVVEGVEAGGHRASFDDDRPGDLGLLALFQLVREATDLPLRATGGIATGPLWRLWWPPARRPPGWAQRSCFVEVVNLEGPPGARSGGKVRTAASFACAGRPRRACCLHSRRGG